MSLQLDLYNGALLLLKEEALASLTEAREPRYKLDQIWNEGAGGGSLILDACLSEGGWAFAKRTVRLDYDNNVNPTFGYRYACAKPSDYVRQIAISGDENFSEPLNAYNDEANYFLSDYTILYLRYVSKDPAYGYDSTRWHPVFKEYVKAYMAYKIVGRLTGSKVDPEEIRREKARLLMDAQGKDAIERPVSFPSRGTWVRSRHGRRGYIDPERR